MQQQLSGITVIALMHLS